ncbi:uncharacterized protein LOC115607636 isoform X2 [Strigops habroptila]|uniref:uncharacterized protein LOC115607636 isoform X2 n=1 Tax=Strigops habroptila TaxID=2489341 RepID=UPI0011CFE54A|nr:uncharacterized protein LOC115607636 isoform X2 [Strigops habroptila]XP_030341017.1 uncharacterized protein LOC115607636 isoform X2 [Strigops habroptila]XP_030341018.1 uncharacterized protein LOC115607636 isoform X2 [Strigops habroptila]XP_032775789.1 uncharacterized protein LOC115607636 isoform X2 [Strigops habroptila]
MPRFRRRWSSPGDRPAGSPGAGGRAPRGLAVPAAASRDAGLRRARSRAKRLRCSTWEEELPKTFQTFAPLALPKVKQADPLLIKAGEAELGGRCGVPARPCAAQGTSTLPGRLSHAEHGAAAGKQGGHVPGCPGCTAYSAVSSALQPEAGGETRTLLPRDGLGTSGNGQRYFPRPFPSSQHEGKGRIPRPAAQPGTHSCSPGRERWQQIPGERPGMPVGADSPCRGHVLASSPEIPTSMPVTPAPQTGRPLLSLGAQPRAVAEEVAVEGTASPAGVQTRAGRNFLPSPLQTRPDPNLCQATIRLNCFARCSTAMLIPDNAQSSIVLKGTLYKIK